MSYGRIGRSGCIKTRSFPRADEARAQVVACLGKRASAPRRIGVAYVWPRFGAQSGANLNWINGFAHGFLGAMPCNPRITT